LSRKRAPWNGNAHAPVLLPPWISFPEYLSKTALLARRLRQLLPKAPCDTACSWAGTFAETPDGLPYIGVHPGVPHILFALGYGGNGITFSVIAAEIIRDLVCEGHSRDAELFRFDRAFRG